MTGPAAAALAAGLELADMHRDANKELGRHWPDAAGVCEGCGEDYPCGEEWAAMKLISVVESRWRREGQRLADAQRAQNQAATVAAGNEGQES